MPDSTRLEADLVRATGEPRPQGSVPLSTIQLSAGSTNEVPSSISFSPDYTRVSIVPQAPLPPSTVMTVAISGVTSEAGKPVATKTTHFTTAAQPDFTAPFVVSSSVLNGQTNVPVNSAFSMQFSKPMDIGSFISANVNVYCSGALPATVSWSTDQTTIFIVPNSPLAVGDQYGLWSYSMTDLSGITSTAEARSTRGNCWPGSRTRIWPRPRKKTKAPLNKPKPRTLPAR